MGTLGAGSATTCIITGLPTTYNPCDVYTITVKSEARVLAHKIWAAAGTLTGGTVQGNCRHTGGSKQTSSTFTWKAPNGELASVALKSLCGGLQGGATLLLSSHNVARNTGAPAFVEGCPAPTSSPTSQAPSVSPTAAPTVSPPIGPDGLAPAANNWRIISYADLRVPPGQQIKFLWNGPHSVVRYKNQADWQHVRLKMRSSWLLNHNLDHSTSQPQNLPVRFGYLAESKRIARLARKFVCFSSCLKFLHWAGLPNRTIGRFRRIKI